MVRSDGNKFGSHFQFAKSDATETSIEIHHSSVKN
jgi:hypothetical protein